MDSRPIKYSDLISPDNSINELITKLEQLGNTFTATISNIRQQASGLVASLQNVSGATQQGQQATAQAARETDKLAQAQKQLTFAESANAKELARLKAQIKETNDITKLTERLNRSAEGSYNRLSAQYSLNKIRLNQMTQAERENTAAGRQLVKETNNIYQQMKGLQEVTGKYQLNVGNYTNSIIAALGANRGFAGSIMSMGGSMQSVGASIKAFNTALMGLLANPVFLAIAGVAATGAAFKFWMDYNNGIAEATRLTREFVTANNIDATTQEISGLRSEVQALADVYGKEFKETLEGVDTLMSQFGISAGEALDVMNKGFAAGADLNGDMISKIKQFAPAFHDAGISADELLAIISQTRSGIFADSGLDAITMASRKLRDMSNNTREALQGIGIDADDLVARLASGQTSMLEAIQEVSKGLTTVGKNSQEAGAVITDVFGRNGVKAGQQQLKALQDIELELNDVLRVTGEYGKNQMQLVETQKDLNKYTEALFGMNGWDEMKQKSELYSKRALAAVLKATVDIANWFVRIYNNSALVRGGISSIANGFKITYGIIYNGFKSIVKVIEGVGTALEGIANNSLTQIAKGVGMVQGAWVGLGKEVTSTVTNAFKTAKQNIQHGHLNEITIGTDLGGTATLYGDGTGGGATGSGSGGTGKAGSAGNAGKGIESDYKKRLDIIRKAQDAELALVQDQYKKERIAAKYKYNRQIEDLTHQLETEKTLTEQERTAINKTILSLQAQLYAEFNRIDTEEQKARLEAEKKTISLRLQAVKEGSEEEYHLKLQQVENERKLSLLNGAGSAGDINAVAAAQSRELADEYVQAQMAIYDKQQEFAANEFALLKTTEAEKTKFRLEQERARWKKILEINALGNKTLSDEEIANIRNIIQRIDNEIDSTKANDIYSLVGLNLSDEQRAAIDQSMEYAMQALNTFTEAQVRAAEAKVNAANKEVDAAQKVLDAELEARANGYANNVLMAQKELEQQKRTQEQALAQQRRAQKQQEAVQTAQQAVNLVTASAKIWADLGFPWAIPALAVMWSSFLYSKIKASQVTKGTEQYGEGTVELLEGGSHASGNDIDLGRKKDGTRRRAEGGEFFAVINKRSSRKFRGIIPDVIQSLNDGTFANKYATAYDAQPVINVASVDLGNIGSDVRAIRDNSQRRVYVDGMGRTIEINGNVKRITR